MTFDSSKSKDMWSSAISKAVQDWTSHQERIQKATNRQGASLNNLQSSEDIIEDVSSSEGFLGKTARSLSARIHPPAIAPKPTKVVKMVAQLRKAGSESLLSRSTTLQARKAEHSSASNLDEAQNTESNNLNYVNSSSSVLFDKKAPEVAKNINSGEKMARNLKCDQKRHMDEVPVQQNCKNGSLASVSSISTSSINNAKSNPEKAEAGNNKAAAIFRKPIKSVNVEGMHRNSAMMGSKSFAYVVQVVYQDNGQGQTRKTFDEIFELHLNLMGHFPEEAGVAGFKTSGNRIIPEIPPQIMYVTEAVALSRIKLIQEYFDVI
jgi:hypothetical protein